MNQLAERLSLYTFLVLIFLGLSKLSDISEQTPDYIKDEKVISHFFPGKPVTIILLDFFRAGFLIQTYYMKLKVVRGLKHSSEVVVRTSEEFYIKNKANIGMSIFRRYENGTKKSTTVLPPGSLYIGNPVYGRWNAKKDGRSIWDFYKAYGDMPKVLLWGQFRPDAQFYRAMLENMDKDKAFYGMDNDFGTDGAITKKHGVSHVEDWTNKANLSISKYISQITYIPPWKIERSNL